MVSVSSISLPVIIHACIYHINLHQRTISYCDSQECLFLVFCHSLNTPAKTQATIVVWHVWIGRNVALLSLFSFFLFLFLFHFHFHCLFRVLTALINTTFLAVLQHVYNVLQLQLTNHVCHDKRERNPRSINGDIYGTYFHILHWWI